MMNKLHIRNPMIGTTSKDPPLFGNKQQNTYDFVNMLEIVKQKKQMKYYYLQYDDYLTDNILLQFEWILIDAIAFHHSFRCRLYSSGKYEGNIPLNIFDNLIDEKLLNSLCKNKINNYVNDL